MQAGWQAWLNTTTTEAQRGFKNPSGHTPNQLSPCLWCRDQVSDIESPPGDSSEPSARVEKLSQSFWGSDLKLCGFLHQESSTFRLILPYFTSFQFLPPSHWYLPPLNLLPEKVTKFRAPWNKYLRISIIHSLENKGMFRVIASSTLLTFRITRNSK